MPKKKKNRNWITPAVFVAVTILVAVAGWLLMVRNANAAKIATAQTLEKADEDFGRRALVPARKRYDTIAKSDLGKLDEGDAASVKDLALLMCDLCDSLKAGDVEAIDQQLQSLRELPESLEFVPEELTVLSRDERVAEVTNWVSERSEQDINALESQSRTSPIATLDEARTFVSAWDPQAAGVGRAKVREWILHASSLGIDPGRLSRAIAANTNTEQLAGELANLVKACEAALGSMNEQELTDAMHQWEKIKHSPLTSEQLWVDYRNQLRGAMRQQLAAQPSSAGANLQFPGKTLAQGPRQYDLEEIVALPKQTSGTASDLTFVRVHELCYALNSTDGSARWVIETGYDAKWLPEIVELDQEKFVICAWRENRQDMISVLSADDGSQVWTLALPPTSQLAGPPRLFKTRLQVLLKEGELWSLNLSDGRPLSRLKLPETTSSPLAIREDGLGAMVFGDKLGVFLVEFSGVPKILDVLFPPKSPNTLSSRGMWVPPFALVFQNELTDRCKMLVYRVNDDRYSEIQQVDLTGRVWDTPVAVGAEFLVVTDAVNEMIMHVDVQAPVDPVTVRFNRESRMANPLRPYFVGHGEAPFISMQRAKVSCFWFDSLSRRPDQAPKVRWENRFPASDFTPIQPLQTGGDQVVVAAQSPSRRSVLVRALDVSTGNEKWSTELGGEITNVLRRADELLLRTDAGQLVRIRGGQANRWTSEILNLPPTDMRLDWIPQASAVIRVADSPPRLQVINYSNEVLVERSIAGEPAGPLAVKVGDIGARNDKQFKKRGVWSAYVDSKQRFQVMGLSKSSSDQTVVYQQLENVPGEGWMRPAWLDDSAILAAHPSGLLVRVDVYHEGDLTYLKRIDQRERQLEPLASPPLAAAGGIWAATIEGSLVRLNRDTLLTESIVKLPAAASTELSLVGDRLMVGLESGQVAVISTAQPFQLVSANQICNRKLRFASPTSRGLLLVDAEGQAHMVGPDGAALGKSVPAPPMTVPPVELSGRLFVATSSGHWRPLLRPSDSARGDTP